MSSMDETTQIDGQIGLPTFGINLIARPPEAMRNRFSAIQDLVEASSPEDCLYRCPPATLHLSVFQFVWARRRNAAGARAEWLDCQTRMLESIAAVTSPMLPFILSQGRIQVGSSAIFLRFETSPALELLRDGLAGIATSALSCSNRPAIQHVSLFRYRRTVAMRMVQEACTKVSSLCDGWEVGALQLLQENTYPSIDVSLIDDFLLAA